MTFPFVPPSRFMISYYNIQGLPASYKLPVSVSYLILKATEDEPSDTKATRPGWLTTFDVNFFSSHVHVQHRDGFISNVLTRKKAFLFWKKMVLQNIKPIWSKWRRHDRSTRPLSLSLPENSGSYLAAPLKTKPMLLQMEISTETQNGSFNYFCISVSRVDPLFGEAPCLNLISIFLRLPERFMSVVKRETGEIKAISDGKSNTFESSLKSPNTVITTR